VFLDNDASDGGLVKIGDYGLSKFISCSRRSGQTESVGTVHYMAPEIANGRYGREIDTYALGVMLYEMLTGHVPFEGESVGEVLMKHLTAEPNLSGLKEPYREIVKRTLAKDPQVRIATVGELLAMLPQESGTYKVPPPYRPARNSDGIGGTASLGDPTVRGQRAPAPPPYQPEPIREPLLAAVSSHVARIRNDWAAWPVNRMAKAIVLLAVAFLLLRSIGTWLPVAGFVLAVYLVYYVLWSLLIKPAEQRHQATLAQQRRVHEASLVPVSPPHTEPSPPAATPVSEPGKYYAYRRRKRVDWQQKVSATLAAKPASKLASELLGSMALSGIVCAFLSVLVVLMFGATTPADGLPLLLWTATVSTVGTWTVLATAKLTEGRVEDQIPMRMAMLVCGAAVGCFAWWMSDLMMMGLPQSSDIGLRPSDTMLADMFNLREANLHATSSYNVGEVTPSIIFSVIHFALLFLTLRWWRLAEYVRTSRLNVWWIFLSAGGAWLVGLVAWYPQPISMLVAAIIAIAAQISSPWLVPSQRKSLVEETVTSYGGYN
jgi:hypothetical protein